MELKATKLSKSYSDKKVVDKIDITVSSGQTVGLLGPNGAGKTTFFYMIAGLLSCDSGDVFINNNKITKENISTRSSKGLSYLPQEPSIFRRLSVSENIMAGLEQRENIEDSDKENILNELLDEFGLLKFKHTKSILLSGGERRRLEIARALACNPSFLLLDEPFAGIDPIAVSDLKETIKKLNSKNLGILISDHNVRDTMQICHKVLIINKGKIIAEGSSKEVSNNKLVRQVYLGKDFFV